MTIAFDTAPCDRDTDGRLLNVVQLLALNGLCFAAVTAVARAAGLSWGTAILAGWIGGAVLCLLALGAILALYPVMASWLGRLGAERRAAARRAAAVEAWEDDRMADYADFVHQAWETEREVCGQARQGFRATTPTHAFADLRASREAALSVRPAPSYRSTRLH